MTWTIGLKKNGPHNSSVQSDGRIVKTYRRRFQIQTDSPVAVTIDEVGQALGIEAGSPFPENSAAICNDVTIEQDFTRPPHLCYMADVSWATNAPLPAEVNADPTTRRVLWSLRPTIQSRYIIRDKNNKLIVNTAGQPFEGGIPVDVRLGTAIARRNKTAVGYNKDDVLANSGKLNSTTFLGGAPGTVQVDIEAEERYEGSFHYWEETYTFNYDPQGWQPKPVNAGFFQLDPDQGVTPITVGDLNSPSTNDATRVQEPEPLDADGLVIPYENRPDACIFVDVEYFGEMDFATFGLT